jgi:hypothetical protein
MNTEHFNREIEKNRAAKNAPVLELQEEMRPEAEDAADRRPGLNAAMKRRAEFLDAEVNSVAWNELPGGFPLNGREPLRQLESVGDPVAILDEGLRMLRDVDISQFNDGTGANRWPVDPNRRAVLVENIRMRLRAAKLTGHILKLIETVREQINARAKDLQNPSGDVGKPPELVVVAGKRPTPKPTKVDTFHRVLPKGQP